MPKFGEPTRLSELGEKNHNDLDARDAANVHPHSSLESIGAEDHHTLPIRATMWHNESTVLIGNALTHNTDTSQRYNSHSYQFPSADGDTWENTFYLKLGIYTLWQLARTCPNCGKQDIYIDNVQNNPVPIDWYSVGVVNNVIKTLNIMVMTSGEHTIKSVVHGKNASAGGYNLRHTKYWIK